MVKSYCVKQKEQAECVPGSEIFVKIDNERTMIKCKCAECGIIKQNLRQQERETEEGSLNLVIITRVHTTR